MLDYGFADLQVNGIMGVDFSRPGLKEDDVYLAAAELAARGTAVFCPTVITSPMETYRRNLPVLAAVTGDPSLGGGLPGIHLEGPFISPQTGAVGAHRPEFVRPPSVDDFQRLQEWAGGRIIMLTLAPETKGAEALISHAASSGVLVSLGHHLADRDSLQRAVDAGARCSTHLGNGLPALLPRHDNPVWWQLACDDLYGCFITDGHHLPVDLVKVALRAKGIERFLVVSDASSVACLSPGTYEFAGDAVEVEPGGRVLSQRSGTLAGSHATMLECMNWLASLGLLDEAGLRRAGRDNPLRLLGLPQDTAGLPGRKPFRLEKGRFVPATSES